MNTRGGHAAPHNETPDGRAELEQLADALTQQGYDTTLITPAPYLAVRIPGATIPQMIYNTGGRFWWNTAQEIAPTQQVTIAADVITWALRTHPSQPPTHDTTTPLASTTPSPPHGSAGGQEC